MYLRTLFGNIQANQNSWTVQIEQSNSVINEIAEQLRVLICQAHPNPNNLQSVSIYSPINTYLLKKSTEIQKLGKYKPKSGLNFYFFLNFGLTNIKK